MVHGVSDEELHAAVAASRSWRGVLRAVGKTSPRVGRDLKARCDELGVSYEHFRAGPSDEVVRRAVGESSTWAQALSAAGYGDASGSARAQLRKRASLLGLSVAHLDLSRPGTRVEGDLTLDLTHLRDAGEMLVAAYLALAGFRVSRPLEPAPYDLLADGPGGIQRVQVKTGTCWVGGTWQCGLTRSVYDAASGHCVASRYDRGEVDSFGIVDGDLRVYLIPFAILGSRGSIQVSAWQPFELRPPRRAQAAIR